MNKLIISLVFFTSISSITLLAQSINSDPVQEAIVPYRLFKTANKFTLIQLETATGKMWLIQYDVQGNNRGGTVLNDKDLSKTKDTIPGRFTLYSTDNIWTFILLDQLDGRSWQVQWSLDKENRFTIPIME